MKRFITLSLLLSCSILATAQNRTIKGIVKDAETNAPIPGVAIYVDSSATGTVTDLDGSFSLNISANQNSLKVSSIGYSDRELLLSGAANLGEILLEPETFTLNDVVVSGQVANLRKTPVVASNVYAIDIDQKLGNQEFIEILKYTPGVHVNRQGGGWGDSEIFMRGFDNSNIAVMVNGIPINDPETGTVYWSDWASLSDVTSVIQTQRGIGASKVTTPSVGGTINIITNRIDVKKGSSVSYAVGNDGYNKASFSVNTGLLDNGWALSLKGTMSSGNGYVQGTGFRVYNYFMNLSKRINSAHQISLMAFGAPHRQYSRANALTPSEWDQVSKLYSVPGGWRRYNPDYGFNASGIRKSNEYSEYFKPFFSLNHVWQISDKSNLSTSLYASFGHGGGYSGKADEDDYSEYDWYSTDYGALNRKFRAIDGTYDYAKIEGINIASTTGSKLVMSQQDGKQEWLGLVSTYSNKFLNVLDFSAGIDVSYYKSAHTNRLIDLFGGEYYIDPCRSEVNIGNNSSATPAWMQEHLGVGDVIYRDYDTNIMKEEGFVQLEYVGDRITAFLSGAVSFTTFWKYDRFYYDAVHARSENITFPGGTVKTGLNWNINKNNNVFVNAGFISRAPMFKSGAFMSPTSSNVTNILAKNEKSATAEIGYSFHNRFVSFNASGYFTEWMDKSMTKKGKITEQYYINMTGVNSRHMGVEFDLKARPLNWMEIGAMLSIGDWTWDSDNVKGYAYNIAGQAITEAGTTTTPGAADHAWAVINMKGVKVGGSAQTTAAIDIALYPFSGFLVGAGYTYLDRNYAYYSLSGSSLKIGKELYVSDPWRIPSYVSLDLRASYQFPIGKFKASVSAIMNNALDNFYIEKAWNPSSVASEKKAVNPDDVYYFYALGRTWSVRLKIDF